MGDSTSEEIVENLLEASSKMKMCHLLQVSMDGPNVNWPFLKSSNHHDEFNMTVLGLNLDLLCIQQSDAIPCCENYAKLYFDTKSLEKGLNRWW